MHTAASGSVLIDVGSLPLSLSALHARLYTEHQEGCQQLATPTSHTHLFNQQLSDKSRTLWVELTTLATRVYCNSNLVQSGSGEVKVCLAGSERGTQLRDGCLERRELLL